MALIWTSVNETSVSGPYDLLLLTTFRTPVAGLQTQDVRLPFETGKTDEVSRRCQRCDPHNCFGWVDEDDAVSERMGPTLCTITIHNQALSRL